MALMEFREPNQAKWQGTRPGHNGDQVLETGANNAVAVNLVYTVAPGAVLFLTHIGVGAVQGGANILTVHIYDNTPVSVESLMYCTINPTISNSYFSDRYWPPIEIPADYSIRVEATVALWYSWVIHGWAE